MLLPYFVTWSLKKGVGKVHQNKSLKQLFEAPLQLPHEVQKHSIEKESPHLPVVTQGHSFEAHHYIR